MFGTDGIRGKANVEITPELALQLGSAGAQVLARHVADRPPRILIGTDTRQSADMLESALVAGMCAVGAQVYRAGVVPSPAMALLVRKHNMDAGVMLSASHNPMPDNGIKFFDADGNKLTDAIEDEIEACFHASAFPRPTGAGVGRCASIAEAAAAEYVEFSAQTVPDSANKPFAGLRVALDCAHGATSVVGPLVFAQLGADVDAFYCEPDGKNINEACGSTHIQSLQARMEGGGYDIGFAFDGDGDRIFGVDNQGQVMDGDAIMAICALALKRAGKLDALVATVMSNIGLEIMCQREGIRLLRTQVGDRYVLEKLQEGEPGCAPLLLGGEQSGHIIFYGHNTTGDGVLTALQLLCVMQAEGKTAAELRQCLETFPQAMVGAKLDNAVKHRFDEKPAIREAMAALEAKLEGNGRLLVRASGTEPQVRVMIEGRNQHEVDAWATELAGLIEKEWA